MFRGDFFRWLSIWFDDIYRIMEQVLDFQKRLTSRVETASKAAAIIGGIILIGLAGLTILSVIGRTINAYGFGPIPGDFELVENGTAFVVFCAMPYCQMRFGHVSVDILSRRFDLRLSWAISLASHCAMSVIAMIITIQLYHGMMDKYQWGETSFILQLPAWWGYGTVLPASALWVVACLTATAAIATDIAPDSTPDSTPNSTPNITGEDARS